MSLERLSYHRTMPVAVWAWLALNAIDVLLTLLSLHLGAVEVNLFLSSIAALRGPQRMLLVKLLLSVSVAGIMYQSWRPSLWKAVNWGMVAVVTWNMLIISYGL